MKRTAQIRNNCVGEERRLGGTPFVGKGRRVTGYFRTQGDQTAGDNRLINRRLADLDILEDIQVGWSTDQCAQNIADRDRVESFIGQLHMAGAVVGVAGLLG